MCGVKTLTVTVVLTLSISCCFALGILAPLCNTIVTNAMRPNGPKGVASQFLYPH